MLQNKKILLLTLIIIAIGAFLIFTPVLAQKSKVLENPLPTNDINVLIGRVIKAVLGIVGSLALLMIIYGGFMMLTSRGKEEQITKAKGAIVWAIIGLVVIFLSYAILNFILEALTKKTQSNNSSPTIVRGSCICQNYNIPSGATKAECDSVAPKYKPCKWTPSQ